ncbi:MBL fold metallo-hydrolase [Mycolicibacterium gadium]|uniref:MBL fold metallo-hydrolase n=1 Tax=Mycolicibacterium gadium TaxID=1794 RepID=A0ABT6GN45_MYCGU|nr:MBL fold metallo-hydrolase [Mycolicibacterium gadium]MDG5482948.1 MBL fold metallo-hydrolase [Mycolicibacterium gadium]
MKVHHLNCGTMNPYIAPRIVCHVLLIETDNGLVLVDTGYGTRDCDDHARVGPTRHLFKPVFDHGETALRQVERLGFNRSDVRHIVVTHFDMDHIGGISDFPDAQVHATSAEIKGAVREPTFQEKMRFRAVQWAHGPKIVEHEPTGEKWRGFAAAKELDDIAPGIVLVSLPGHTRGHACIAVDAGNRWVLHCGDAFYQQGTLDGISEVPRPIRIIEPLLAFDRKKVADNHARLTELYQRQEPDLLMVCAHDAELYEHAKATS